MFKKLWNNLVPEKEIKTASTLKFNGENISEENLQKINKAKEYVANKVEHPQALFFNDSYTLVNGSTVTLRYTCNGETKTEQISVA